MVASKNLLEQKLHSTNEKVHEAQKIQDHFDYGIITGIDLNSYQVQVKLSGIGNEDVLGSGFWPLITQREMIFMLWGQLRNGMAVRVHWRGPFNRANWALVEIIGDENANFIKQLAMENDPNLGPHKLLSGGLPL